MQKKSKKKRSVKRGKNVGSLSYFRKKEKKVRSHSHFACAKAKNNQKLQVRCYSIPHYVDIG